jgi:eukaryotic-like serine/threonine-protein kinase
MTPERWQEIKQVLYCALERPPDERAQFLDQASAHDPSLRQEVDLLLVAEARAGAGFLNEHQHFELIAAASSGGTPAEAMDIWIGRRVGPYKIVEQIGIGGMGEVYRAIRVDDQYHKEVALKMVRGGQDSGFIVGRFKNERQILATLDHPHIARLHDGGATEDGVPYFVMELIDGQSIDQYCNRHQLSITERLRLFLLVCSAVQYAHQHLVIHRDIKPSNILVTSGGTPKLLDFGIAKILDSEAVDGNFEPTLTVFRLLTPGYASPEQIKGDPITTASDVYSLGVVLYELLTGCHPYRRQSSTPQEIANAVCEIEPEKPSTAVRRLKMAEGGRDSQRSSDAPALGSSPAKQSKRLRGDLDNIILMALRKEPQRRYTSAERFAEDIRCHLESLPVIARQDTLSYRASKFITRHRTGVAASAAVFLTLLVGLTITLHEAQIARRERIVAVQRFNDVRELANSLLFDIHDSIRDLPGATVARKLLVDRALKYLDSLSREAADRPDLERELSAAYERVGDVQGNPRYANLGDTAGAVASYRKALRIRLALADGDRVGSVDDRVALTAVYVKLGFGLGATSDFPAALKDLQQAYHIGERLAAEQKDNPQAQEAFAMASFALGECFSNMGNLASALEFYRKSAAIREAITGGPPTFRVQVQTNLAGVYDYMSEAVYLQGDLDAALSFMDKSHQIIGRLVESDPLNGTLQQFLLQEEYGIGYYLAEKGLPKQALPHYHIALAGYQKLASSDAHDVVVMRYLSKCYMSMGRALAAEGHAAQGIESARNALRNLEALSAADQADTSYKAPDVAYARSALAETYARFAVQPGTPYASKTASWREARYWYQKSLDIWLLLEQKAPLARWDATQPNKIANEIAKCDAALAKSHGPKSIAHP